MGRCGRKFSAYPNCWQREILSQWIGCCRVIYNAKCDEDFYFRTFIKHSLALTGLYPPVDCTYAQFKTELTPYLNEVPSIILRNSAHKWYESYQRFFKGLGGRPKRKKKGNKDSIYLTNELFSFEKQENGSYKLFIGTLTNNIGYLKFHAHRDFEVPNSITISVKNKNWYVSFNYDNNKIVKTEQELIDYYSSLDKEVLEEIVVGGDRGVVVPLQLSSGESYDFTEEEKASLDACDYRIKKLQKRLARQQLGSNKRFKTKLRIGKLKEKQANIRRDRSHKITHDLAENETTEVLVLEELKVKNMTKKPKAKFDEKTGKWLKNGARAKAGLNKSILNSCWGHIKNFSKYKCADRNKLLVEVSPINTSNECAECCHTQPENRPTQETFLCQKCGHQDNADNNAARVIKKRGVNKLLKGEVKVKEVKKIRFKKGEKLSPDNITNSPAGTRVQSGTGNVYVAVNEDSSSTIGLSAREEATNSFRRGNKTSKGIANRGTLETSITEKKREPKRQRNGKLKFAPLP